MLQQSGQQDCPHVPLKFGRLAEKENVLVVGQVEFAGGLHVSRSELDYLLCTFFEYYCCSFRKVEDGKNVFSHFAVFNFTKSTVRNSALLYPVVPKFYPVALLSRIAGNFFLS